MEKDKKGARERKSLVSQRRVLLASLLLNVGAVIPVIAIGILSRSLVLFSDLYDYIYNILSEIIAILIINQIIKGKTTTYDYGPGKIESLGALAASILTVVGLAATAFMSVERLVRPEPLVLEFTLMGVGLNIIGICVEATLWWRAFRLARASGSPLMEAHWRLLRVNVLGAAGVIVSLLAAVFLGRFRWSIYIDPFCALIFIFLSGIAFVKLIRETLHDLADRTLNEDLQMKILKRLSEHYDMYDSFHGVRSRRAGKKRFIEIALGLEPNRSLGEFFDLAGRIKETIESDIPSSEVRVFPRPVEEHDESSVSRKISADIDVIPISDRTITSAMALAKKALPEDEQDFIRMVLEESWKAGTHTAKLQGRRVSRPRFWVAMRGGRLLGFSGIYFDPDDAEAVWGGLTAIDDSAGMSRARALALLFRKFVFEARKTGRRYIRAVVGSMPPSAGMKRLYSNYGFRVFETELGAQGNTVVYRQAEIEPVYQALHSAKSKNRIRVREE